MFYNKSKRKRKYIKISHEEVDKAIARYLDNGGTITKLETATNSTSMQTHYERFFKGKSF